VRGTIIPTQLLSFFSFFPKISPFLFSSGGKHPRGGPNCPPFPLQITPNPSLPFPLRFSSHHSQLNRPLYLFTPCALEEPSSEANGFGGRRRRELLAAARLQRIRKLRRPQRRLQSPPRKRPRPSRFQSRVPRTVGGSLQSVASEVPRFHSLLTIFRLASFASLSISN